MSIYLTRGFDSPTYNGLVMDGNPHEDFNHLVGLTKTHAKVLNSIDADVEAIKSEQLNVIYGEVSGYERRDELLERSVMFIDIDEGDAFDVVVNRLNKSVLSNTNMVIYPTISNGIKGGTRARVGVELSRSVNQKDYIKVWSVITKAHGLEPDLNGVTQNWNQLAGIYVETTQNSLNTPYIKTDGEPLNVAAFIEVYDNQPAKFRIEEQKRTVGATSPKSGNKPWSVVGSQVMRAMLDPESNYKEFGGWNKMLTKIAGWVFRQTNSIEITANWIEQVNGMGSDPISDSELRTMFISWAKNFK